MNKPTIEIEGKKFEIVKIKPRQWREFFKFDSERRELPLSELMQGHCEAISPFFDGEVSADYLLDNMDIADVLRTYHEIRAYLMERITAKLEIDSKNAEEGGSQD